MIERRMDRMLTEPVSVRRALQAIVGGTITVVVGSALLMRLLDHREYRSYGRGLWWAIQTVTTVGYGDVTPTTVAGRAIGSFVLIESIAFLSIVTAVITSTFVEQGRRQHRQDSGEPSRGDLAAMITDLTSKIDRLEATVRDLGDGPELEGDRDR
jgi:voltage-gated potassium channel Kch